MSPSVSPAEAYEYQQKVYTAPVGSDVYSIAKRILAEQGYTTAYIDPEAPVFPAGMDVLVWLQPRFPKRAYPQFAKFMAEGGKAFVALQHYNVQQRQYRGAGFRTVYWPQPQFHAFNDYLQLVDVRQIGDKYGDQPGEVLFDRQHANLVLDTQVNRSAWGERDPQQVSRPFLICAAAEGLSARSVITSRLGSLLFAWGSRFTADESRLGSLGISSTTLVATSPRCWNYAWSGGWIPEESFVEPQHGLLGPQTLAVLLEGPFPRVEFSKDEGQRDIMTAMPGATDSSLPGKLLLVGCSEMFKNQSILSTEHQHGQFLLNAVAFLAHDEELAELQARTRARRSVPFRAAGVKMTWRSVVVGLPPLLFVLYGLLQGRLRRRPILAP